MSEAIKILSPTLLEICKHSKRFEEISDAVRELDIKRLISLKVITKTHEVSKQFLRGKRRDLYTSEINHIEDVLQQSENHHRLKHLQRLSDLASKTYKLWSLFREKEKSSQGVKEFSDLAIGVYRLFTNPDYLSILWLIQKVCQFITNSSWFYKTTWSTISGLSLFATIFSCSFQFPIVSLR